MLGLNTNPLNKQNKISAMSNKRVTSSSEQVAGPTIGNLVAMPVVALSATKDYGLYMANKKAHKRYLRQHHLGKFKKNKAK